MAPMTPMALGALGALGAMALTLLLPATVQAQSFGLCERQSSVSAGDQDLVLRWTARVMRELQRSGSGTALVSRAGTDLGRFGIRYSHAGIALKDNAEGAWAVRQLYYVCDESRPRLFDQGLAAFLLAGKAPEDAGTSFVSIVTLPPQSRDEQLQRRALDNTAAVALLSPSYSANAYAFGLRHQNCNQWVAEMLAAAWDPAGPASMDGASRSGTAEAIASATAPAPPYGRAQAQQWLHAAGYQPTEIQIGSHGLMFLGQWVPLLHVDDHPLDDLYALRMRLSLPGSLEGFMRQQVPSAQRVELCLRGRRVVLHRGWSPLGEGCTPIDPQDEVEQLD